MRDDPAHVDCLPIIQKVVAERSIELVFVTGRHLSSILHAIEKCRLPRPQYIIANVGTEIYESTLVQPKTSTDATYRHVKTYEEDLAEKTNGVKAEEMLPLLTSVQGLVLQEKEKLGPYKLSFYCPGEKIKAIVQSVEHSLIQHDANFHVVSSLDPIDGRGLVDVLPKGVTKCYALDWFVRWKKLKSSQVVFCGDSGNDLHALTAEFNSVLVGNASGELRDLIVQHHDQTRGHRRGLYLCKNEATAGVLEGLQFFLQQSEAAR